MLSLILIIFSASLNAMMDKLAHHWSKSIFSKLKGYFYSDAITESWKNKYVDRDVAKGFIKWNILGIKFNKPVFLTDAWHLYKSSMIITLILAICLYPIMKLSGFWYVDFVILGTAWNLSFNFAYNVWLVKR